MPLTDTAVRAAKPRKDSYYRISDFEGLYLQVETNGSKLWRMAYRFLGKQRTFAIGAYPDVSLADAREKKADARKLLARGIDPSRDKQERAKAARVAADNTFEALSKELIATLEAKNLSPVTIDKKKWILFDLVCPHIGQRPIADLKPSDVLDVLADIEASGRLETTQRARQVVGQVFRLAAVTDRAAGDPTVVLRGQLRSPRVTSHPAIIHPASFGAMLRKIDTYRGAAITRLALQFQAHTFPRPIELRLAEWSEFDLEDSIWRIPAERMKMRRPHDVPLVGATRAILRDVVKVTGRRDGLVFHSPQSWKKPISENTLNKALAILGYKGRHTSHGFRSSAHTIMTERNMAREAVIEFQLAHLEENETKRAYNRAQYLDERVKLTKDWARTVAELKRAT